MQEKFKTLNVFTVHTGYFKILYTFNNVYGTFNRKEIFISKKLIHDAISEVINSVTPAVCRLGKTQIV